MSIHTFYPPAAGDACGGSFAASGDGANGTAGGGGRRKACRSSWDAAIGPRLGDPLQTNFVALGNKCDPGGAAGARDAAKKSVTKLPYKSAGPETQINVSFMAA